jgi:hypothetical protein
MSSIHHIYQSIKSIYLSYPSISLGATAVGSPAIVKYINPEYASSTGSLDSTSTSTATATTTDVVEKEEGIHGMDLLSVEDIKDNEALPPDSSNNNSNNSTIESKSTSSSSSTTTTTSTENNTTKIIIETWSTTWSPKEWPKEWFQNIDSSESVII